MKKKIEKGSGPSRIQKAEENIRIRVQNADKKTQKAKVIRELCNEMVWLFDMPANQGMDGSEIMISNLIDEIAPWQKEIGEEDGSLSEDSKFVRVWEGIKVSFGFGYALGQMLDLPEIDITPIKDLLRDRRALLYMPHEKAA